MSPRFLILIAVAGGLAVFIAARGPATPPDLTTGGPGGPGVPKGPDDPRKMPLWQFNLPGEEPAEEPDLAIEVDVDATGRKNRLYYTISESHDYYVETFYVDFYYKPTPDTDQFDSPFVMSEFINNYVKSGETLRGCLEVVPAEMQKFGGEMGTAENWGAEITHYGRARLKNPETFNPVIIVSSCD